MPPSVSPSLLNTHFLKCSRYSGMTVGLNRKLKFTCRYFPGLKIVHRDLPMSSNEVLWPVTDPELLVRHGLVMEFLAGVKCLSVLAWGISNEKFMPKCIPSDFLSLHSFRGPIQCLFLESQIICFHQMVITLACSVPFPIEFMLLQHAWLDFSLYLCISVAVIFRLLDFNIWIIVTIYKFQLKMNALCAVLDACLQS